MSKSSNCKKPPRQRAVITITERTDGTIACALEFNVSTKGRPLGPIENLAFAASKFLQQVLEKASRYEHGSTIILPNEAKILVPGPAHSPETH